MAERVHSEQAEHTLERVKGTLLPHRGNRKSALDSSQHASQSTDPPRLLGELILEYGRFLRSTRTGEGPEGFPRSV